MAVDQERGSGRKAGRHGLGVAGIELDEDEALPGRAVGFGVGFQPGEERLLELEDLFHVHADDEGLGGGGERIGEDNVFEFVAAGGKNGGALVDLGGIEEVEDGEVLDVEDLVHAFEGESALAVEEVGDVGLLESGLLGEAESGEFPCCDAFPENFSEIVLQNFELHGRSIALGSEGGVSGENHVDA